MISRSLLKLRAEGDVGSSRVHRDVVVILPHLEESHGPVADLEVPVKAPARPAVSEVCRPLPGLVIVIDAPAAVVTDELEVPVLRQIDEGV